MLNKYNNLLVLLLATCTSLIPSIASSGQSIETIDRLRNKAEKLYGQGDYTGALTHYLNGYKLARQLDGVRAANLAVDISSVYHMRGEFRQAATLCHEGVALLKRSPVQPDSVWFKLNSSMGEMYKKLDNQDSCYLYFSRANALLQKHPNLEAQIADYVIYYYNNQGMMYVRAGGYTEGFTYLTKALTIAEKQATSVENLAILQNNLGELYEGLGLFEKALGIRKRAEANYHKDDLYKCGIYNGIAKDALQSKLYPEARYYAMKAAALASSIARNRNTRLTTTNLTLALNCLGQCAYQTGDYAQAGAYYKRAILYQKQHTDYRNPSLSDSFLGLARLLRKQGYISDALRYCQQAITASLVDPSLSRQSVNPAPDQAVVDKDLFAALILKADLLNQHFGTTRHIPDLHRSYQTYESALAIADAIRKSYNTLDTKWFFATQVRPAYLSAFTTANSLYQHTRRTGNLKQAFSVLERAKAAALTDVTRELLIKPANVPAELLTQERTLQRTISTLKLDNTGRGLPGLTDARIQLAQLQQRLEKEFPAYYRAKYQPQSVKLAQIQATLDNKTAYLSFLSTPDSLYSAIVTREGLHFSGKAENAVALKTAVQSLYTALYTNPGLGNYTGTSAAKAAYQGLIQPVSHLLKGKTRLVISRDGDLHRLPFEILETGQSPDDFLVRHYAISYVASATSLLQTPRKQSIERTSSLLALAPFAEPIKTRAPSLPVLPASRSEVENLMGESIIGKAATKRRFMANYANHELLHLATHAQANDTEPARSYIAFYPDGNPDKLYAEEIYNLFLTRTRLVVLSACETGNGKLQAGEGVLSLAQAFAYAGCPSVISTLWNAHDASTAYLSQRLYTYLQAGYPIDVALQRTRIDYFQSDLYPQLNHPHYWANLVLIGAAEPVYAVPSIFPPWLSIGSVIVLLIGSVFYIRWRRSRLITTTIRSWLPLRQ